MKRLLKYSGFALIMVGVMLVVGQGGLGAETVSVPWQEQSAHQAEQACINGMAGIYPCHNVDMLSHLTLAEIGAGEGVLGNDHWGWTDTQTGRDFVIFGLTDGTSFIEITDRMNPTYLGKLPTHDGVSVWRDIKVYQNHAYITADIPIDIPANHGLQVFDLTQLRTVVNPPVTFNATTHYDGFGPGHNLWINEESGFLYVFRSDTCNAGIHMINIQEPANPQFAGCLDNGEPPLSDAECINYEGPDVDYQGREICFIGSDDNVAIADVSDKSNPVIINDFTYPGIVRAHQGALTTDQRYWILSDMMDEMMNGHNTRIYVFDVADLDAPQVLGQYEYGTTARDHNIYIVDDIAYQTNWKAGLRVLNIAGLPSTDFLEVGFFDTSPNSHSIAMAGAWSNYPWWSDGIVTVSGTHEGLFVLRPFIPRLFLPIIQRK